MKQPRSISLNNSLLFGLFILLNFSLYYHYNFAAQGYHYYSDFPTHVARAKHFWHEPRVFYEPAFHILTSIVAWGFLLNYKIAAALLITGMQALITYIYYRFFDTLDISLNNKVLLTAIMTFASTIFIPFTSKHFLIGVCSTSVWHNPTLTMVKPFAIIITFLTATYFESDLPIKKGIALGFLLLLSSFFKPSFSEVFIPALTLYGFLFYPKNRQYISRWFLLIAPATTLLLIQLLFWRKVGARIAFEPGLVIGTFTHHYVTAVVRACAFPLAILLFHRPFQNKALILSWIYTFVAYAQFFLVAEMPRYQHGNFGWSYSLGLSLVFLFSLMELAKWCREEKITTPKHLLTASRTLQITAFLLLAHAVTGVVLFVRIYFGGTYF